MNERGHTDQFIKLRCTQCGRSFKRDAAEHRYRLRHDITRPFCSMACHADSRRTSTTEKKARKAEYDRQYGEANRARILANKAAYFQRTYDPDKARVERKKRIRYHVEYCRRYYANPVKKAAKVQYDADRRSAIYGEFADAHKTLIQLQREVIRRSPDKYERYKARGYYENKNGRNQCRKRNRSRTISPSTR